MSLQQQQQQPSGAGLTCRRGGETGAGAKLLPLVLLRYRGHADGFGGPGSSRLKNLSSRGHKGNRAALLAICCSAVPPCCPMTVPGNKGLGCPANAPSSFFFFSFQVRQTVQATSYSLGAGAVVAPVVALARQVTSHAALVPLGSSQSHVRLSPAPVFGVALP